LKRKEKKKVFLIFLKRGDIIKEFYIFSVFKVYIFKRWFGLYRKKKRIFIFINKYWNIWFSMVMFYGKYEGEVYCCGMILNGARAVLKGSSSFLKTILGFEALEALWVF